MFSSIEVEKRAEVVQKCYWPLLNLAEKGHKLSLEATAITLEYIAEIDKSWIGKLKQLIAQDKIEFIGSGYSQIIAPIVPCEVNSKNLSVGQEVYSSILDWKPEIYLVNEMAFSVDLIATYNAAGVKSVILEWNNFYKFTNDAAKEHSFKPLKINDCEGNSLNVIWADTIFFQKFQRYVHGELDKDSYLDFIRKKVEEKIEQYIPVYSSDAEIFDFRPGRYKTENSLNANEWGKIEAAYQDLQKYSPFIFLKDILKECEGKLPSLPFSSLIPIQVKKQDKYNIYRWAVGGRNNLKVNADCYRLLSHYINSGVKDRDSWKELLFFWSSDFRTHITQARYLDFDALIKKSLEKSAYAIEDKKHTAIKTDKIVVRTDQDSIQISTGIFELNLNRNKGLSISSFKKLSDNGNAVIGHIAHGTYDDISYSNDYFSGHAICYDNERKQYTHLFNRSEAMQEFHDRVVIKASNTCNGKFIVEDTISVFDAHVELHRVIRVLDLSLNIIHPFIFTFMPNSGLKDIKYKTTCGGSTMQEYFLSQSSKHTQQSKYLTITALNGFSPTNGLLSVTTGNNEGKIHFQIDNAASPLVASFQYEDEVGIGTDRMPFCRLIFSAQEVNDAYKGNQERNTIIESRLRIF